MEMIGINAVLFKMKAGDPFLLKFVRSSGEGKGSIKTVAKATYGVVNPNFKNPDKAAKEPTYQTAAEKKWRNAGIVPVIDLETGTMLTILISHIVQFNHFHVKH